MYKLGFALLSVVVAVSFGSWDVLNSIAAHGLSSIPTAMMVLGALGLSVITFFISMPAFNGVSWNEHNTMPVNEYSIPCMAGGPDRMTSDKAERLVPCATVAAVTFMMVMVGFLTQATAPVALAMVAIGFIALLSPLRKAVA